MGLAFTGPSTLAAHTELVARIVAIVDPTDTRLGDYTSLRDVQLRRSLEASEGLFVAEGQKVVRRAVQAGYAVRSFLMTQRWLADLEPELAMASDADCYLVSDDVAERVTGFHIHRGALASMQRQRLPTIDAVLATAVRLVVLEDLVDHTNVGAAFRSAAALGADAVLVSPRCADPLYRRSIKVSMGAVFSLPWTRLVDWYDTVPLLRAAGFTTVALTPADDASSIDEMSSSHKSALLVGSEGPGLSARWANAADVRARIPMVAGIDSLNVAAATAVACFALWRMPLERPPLACGEAAGSVG